MVALGTIFFLKINTKGTKKYEQSELKTNKSDFVKRKYDFRIEHVTINTLLG